MELRDKEAMAYELGDVLWYLANAANDLGYTLSEIGEMNLKSWLTGQGATTASLATFARYTDEIGL